MNVITTPSPRIDTAVTANSILRMTLYVCLAVVILTLAWLAPLSLWQYVVLFVLIAITFFYLIRSRLILLHLSQPPLSQRIDHDWQLLISNHHNEALWQAKLVTVSRYHWLLSLEFFVVEPYQRKLSVLIFRDQVSPEQWRELNVLATVYST